MIAGVILSGGRSSRMGRAKALLPIGRRDTFVSRLTRTFHAAGVEDVVVVLGSDAPAIRAHIEHNRIPARVVENRMWEAGQLTSLIAGLEAIDTSAVRAALVTLIDVPLVSAATVSRLIDAYAKGTKLIVRPARDAEHGHPVIFDRALFEEFRRADPRQGAKAVVRAHAADTLNVPIDDEGAFTDIDTPEDYERMIAAGID